MISLKLFLKYAVYGGPSSNIRSALPDLQPQEVQFQEVQLLLNCGLFDTSCQRVVVRLQLHLLQFEL